MYTLQNVSDIYILGVTRGLLIELLDKGQVALPFTAPIRCHRFKGNHRSVEVYIIS